MPDSINYSRGLLYWKNNFNDSLKVVVKYNCLMDDLPFKVGPFFSELPNLDSLVNKTEYKQDSQKLFVRDNIFTSGSINRQLNLSTNGMSEFTGGLNLSLSGMLDNNIMLSAVLSDKELMIQPEGNTRNLEDFDQVLLVRMMHEVLLAIRGEGATRSGVSSTLRTLAIGSSADRYLAKIDEQLQQT